MSDEDLKKIGKLIDERLDQKLDEKLGALEQRFDTKLVDLEQRFDQKLENMSVRINVDIGQFMEDILIPIISEKADKSDIDRIERKLDFVLDKINYHDSRLNEVESILAFMD